MPGFIFFNNDFFLPFRAVIAITPGPASKAFTTSNAFLQTALDCPAGIPIIHLSIDGTNGEQK